MRNKYEMACFCWFVQCEAASILPLIRRMAKTPLNATIYNSHLGFSKINRFAWSTECCALCGTRRKWKEENQVIINLQEAREHCNQFEWGDNVDSGEIEKEPAFFMPRPSGMHGGERLKCITDCNVSIKMHFMDRYRGNKITAFIQLGIWHWVYKRSVCAYKQTL